MKWIALLPLLLAAASLAAQRIPDGYIQSLLETRTSRANKAMAEARAFLRQKKYRKAEAACQQAIDLYKELRPYYFTPYELLGEIYLGWGKNAEALQMLTIEWRPNRWPEKDPVVAIAAARSGNERIARMAATLDLMESASLYQGRVGELSLLPGTKTLKSIEATGLILRATDPKRSADEALEDLRAADKIAPNNPVALYLMGSRYLERKDLAKAREHLKEAIRRGRGRLVEMARERLLAATKGGAS